MGQKLVTRRCGRFTAHVCSFSLQFSCTVRGVAFVLSCEATEPPFASLTLYASDVEAPSTGTVEAYAYIRQTSLYIGCNLYDHP